jgi:hypothetical protein
MPTFKCLDKNGVAFFEAVGGGKPNVDKSIQALQAKK